MLTSTPPHHLVVIDVLSVVYLHRKALTRPWTISLSSGMQKSWYRSTATLVQTLG